MEEKDFENNLRKITKLDLSLNQLKVINDKYLKDSPMVEDWLKTVCHNVSLSEILHSDKILDENIFDGVNCEIIEYDSKGKRAKMFLLHEGIEDHNKRGQNFKKFLNNLEKIRSENPDIGKNIENEFYEMLSNFDFLPNSPTLMNAGRELQQLSACYVLPVEDSIEEIYESVKNMALIHKSGGGTGFSFSRLRPSNDVVSSTKGISSGPLSFMQIFDKSTEVVKQGGTRRGANMGIMHYNHPDILKFIDMKKTPGVMENFNISVTIDDKFMNAVENNKFYELINPRNNEVVGKLNAKDVWKKLISSAWESGDPGIIIIDRINSTASNTTPHLGQIESTNPCGEQPLLPYEPCNLGSINLSNFIDERKKNFDYERLKKIVRLSTKFLDDVIDINCYPIPKIERVAKSTRRIGLGVMGWAESLVKMSIPYNSPEALIKAEKVMKIINETCFETSVELAKERGVFPAFKGSVYDKESSYFRGIENYPRHSSRTTIAPTGTIAIAAGLQGSGIEPFFAIVYVRYNAAGIDALKKGKTPHEKDTFFEANPLFEKIAEENNYFGVGREKLFIKINDNHKSLLGIEEIPEKIQNLFLTSHDLSPTEHVMMQCAFQKYTENAVSKTVNMKNEATPQDVEEVYMLAYQNGAKGVTIYRDGSKQFQILNINDKKKEDKKEIVKKDLPEFAEYYQIETGQGPIHIHINYNEEKISKIFANLSPIGTEISGMATSLAIVLSKYLELGGDPVRILKHLNSIKSEKPYGFGKNRVDSVPHAFSIAIRNHLIKRGKLKSFENGDGFSHSDGKIVEIDKNVKNLYCSKCFSSNVGMISGCSEPTCFDCGYSKCS
ncbi:ribonucleoside-diphosphate reductase, adenosylcobalamin-dependent [Candidatus Pacearchaeota archaeon CG10_big_fil_rev_8_21_14_0_10_32_42]|nr:MAG: ribonucleoside-diphosphate reductase, adenosylcobalamin-dependent [Candidatus Pacearchaeota archaeon CG10_big_fil_rev_8_21_14_0_10_32_42]